MDNNNIIALLGEFNKAISIASKAEINGFESLNEKDQQLLKNLEQAFNNEGVILKTTLNDIYMEEEPISVEVSSNPWKSICIKAKGYSDATSNDDEGVVIEVENNKGELAVRLFADINQQDPTDVIMLSDAKNSHRK